MARKPRDYAKEYERRISKGLDEGKTVQQARGQAKEARERKGAPRPRESAVVKKLGIRQPKVVFHPKTKRNPDQWQAAPNVNDLRAALKNIKGARVRIAVKAKWYKQGEPKTFGAVIDKDELLAGLENVDEGEQSMVDFIQELFGAEDTPSSIQSISVAEAGRHEESDDAER